MDSVNQSGHDAGVVRVEEILDLDALLDRAGGDEEPEITKIWRVRPTSSKAR